jgi:NADH-quinone oxidoreductase subunit A
MSTLMLQPYVPLLLLILFVIANAILMLGVSHIFSSYRRTPTKIAPYESGMPVLGDARERFSVKFYLVAMLFIVFDVEAIFLYPWAVIFRSLGMFGLIEMLVFIGLVFIAYLYVWQRGGLEWEGPIRPRGEASRGLPPSVERTPGDRPHLDTVDWEKV